MSYSFDAKAIRATIPLLQEADRQTPHWIQFATDDDAQLFARMISWLVKSHLSPMRTVHKMWQDQYQPRLYVIQWKVAGGFWMNGLTYRDDEGKQHKREIIRNEQGEYVGRLRFRQARGQE